jgi:hypothetical protein
MKTVIERLNLAEGAGESDVLAAVIKLAEDRDAEKTRADTAELQLAETAKAKRAGEVSVELAEVEKAGNLKPGEKPEFVRLAEEKPEVYEARLADRKALKPNTIVDLAVHGSGNQGDKDGGTKRADVELTERTRARMTKDGVTYSQAKGLELSENPDLATRYDEFLTGKEA